MSSVWSLLFHMSTDWGINYNPNSQMILIALTKKWTSFFIFTFLVLTSFVPVAEPCSHCAYMCFIRCHRFHAIDFCFLAGLVTIVVNMNILLLWVKYEYMKLQFNKVAEANTTMRKTENITKNTISSDLAWDNFEMDMQRFWADWCFELDNTHSLGINLTPPCLDMTWITWQ